MKNRIKDTVELVGIFSIVVSLIFVGYELRQNSSIARFDAFTTISMSLAEYNQILSTDPQLMSIFAEVYEGASSSDFTPEENIQISLQYQALLRIWDSLFRAVDEEILPASYLELVGRAGAFNNPYFRTLWIDELRYAYTSEFVDFFEGN